MHSLFQDIRYGLRTCLKTPGLTALIVVTLALGIGANTTVYSVVKHTLLQPTPYRDPDRLVRFITRELRYEDEDDLGASLAEYFDWCNLCTSYTDIAIHYNYGYNLTGGDRPERVEVVRATVNLLPMLGIDAALGRVFTPDEGRPGAPRVTLLSDGFWRRYFAGDPNVIGQTVELESTPYKVLGVLPHSLDREWGRFDLWEPLRANPENAGRGGVGWVPIARLKPGVSPAQAQAEMDTVSAHLAETYPELNQHSVRLVPFMDLRFSDRDRTALLMLAAAVGFVLLIVCVNVANLLLARAADRRSEFAVRAALGASRWRLMRQAFTESILLASAGGVLGVLLAAWGVEVVVASLSDTFAAYDIGIDLTLLGFTAAVSVITALLFGTAPALLAASVNLNEYLKSGTRSVAGNRTVRRGRDFLLASQIAMAFATVVCAGLLIRSFVALRNVDPGFNTENLLTMEVSVDRNKYPGNYMRRVKFFDAVLDRVQQVPGVTAAAATYVTPLVNTDMGNGVVVEDYVGPTGNGEIMVGNVIVTPGYFETLGIPLLRGRSFTENDVYDAPEALIVSQRAAEHFWPGEDPIGKRIRFGWSDDGAPWIPVVGVVGDITQHGLRRGHPIQVYCTLAQGGSYTSHLTIVARTRGDPLASAKAVQQAVWDIDPEQPAFCVRSMSEIIAENTHELRALALLLSVFAIVALLIAAVGLYGVIAYAVSQCTHEIGIRMALGAHGRHVLRLVAVRSGTLVLVGIFGGSVLALMLGKTLRAIMCGVSPTDPATFFCVALVMIVVSLLASYLPVRRAIRVDPMVALRCN